MEPQRPGEPRKLSGFLKADDLRAIWPEGAKVQECGEPRAGKMPPVKRWE